MARPLNELKEKKKNGHRMRNITRPLKNSKRR